MKKTTTVTKPDGSVTTIKSKSSCGCLTFFVLVLAAGLLVESWQGSSTLERVLYIAVPVIIGFIALGIYGARENRRKAAAPDWKAEHKADRASPLSDAESADAAGQSAPNEQLSQHLEHCERCEQDLPCDEWERLFAASQKSGPKGSKRRSSAPVEDPTEQIRRLGELRDSGLLTDEEFQAKKGELLARM